MKIYEVGGAVRDELMGHQTASADVDFAVEIPTFKELETALKDMGFTLLRVKPEFLTIRAMAPKGSRLGAKNRIADFVMCRKEGSYSDGRHPDEVEPGTIYDDLRRRDFTINAMARDLETGDIIDPHNGKKDLKDRILRFVGDPMMRITEDGLRVLRALRFWVTKELVMEARTQAAIQSPQAAAMIHLVSTDRVREELHKMFSYNTLLALQALNSQPLNIRAAIFRDGLWLEPTTKQP